MQARARSTPGGSCGSGISLAKRRGAVRRSAHALDADGCTLRGRPPLHLVGPHRRCSPCWSLGMTEATQRLQKQRSMQRAGVQGGGEGGSVRRLRPRLKTLRATKAAFGDCRVLDEVEAVEKVWQCGFRATMSGRARRSLGARLLHAGQPSISRTNQNCTHTGAQEAIYAGRTWSG